MNIIPDLVGYGTNIVLSSIVGLEVNFVSAYFGQYLLDNK
jgi:hypothetical protein